MPVDFVASGVLPALSAERFARYQDATSTAAAASALYVWNSKVSADYLELLSWVEVALRNATHNGLMTLAQSRGESRWDQTNTSWFTPWFQPESVSQIRKARSRANSGPVMNPPIGKVVAELTFGFWVRMYSRHYEASLWTPALRHGFPAGVSRGRVHNELATLNKLRNRVAHHEVVFSGDHQRWLATIERVLTWLSPALCTTVLPSSRVHASLQAMRAAQI